MPWIELTRMLERKTKDASRGELKIFAFAGVSPLYLQTEHIAAVYTIPAPVYVGEFDTEMRDVTAVIVAGQEEPFHVAEPIDEVTKRIGVKPVRKRAPRKKAATS